MELVVIIIAVLLLMWILSSGCFNSKPARVNGVMSGYPRVECPPGTVKSFEGAGCIKTEDPNLRRTGGRTLF